MLQLSTGSGDSGQINGHVLRKGLFSKCNGNG